MRKLLLVIMVIVCSVANAATIAEQLLAVNQAKQDIKTAAEAKGVTIGSVPLADYSAIIGAIPYASGASILSTGYLATDTAKGELVTVSLANAYRLGLDTAIPNSAGLGVHGIAMSSDGTRLVYKGRGVGIPLVSYNYNSATGSYEQTAAVSGGSPPGTYFITMSRDGSTVIVPAASAISVYKWSSGNNRYEKQTNPNVYPATGYGAAITDDLTRLVFTDANTGVATWVYTLTYSEANGRYEATTPVDTQPTGRAYGCAVSANGDYLAVAHAGTGRVATYKWNSGNGRYELTADHTATLGTTAISVAMAADGSVVAVGHNSSPFIVTMAWNEGNNRYEPQSAISFGSFGNPTSSCYALSMADDASIIVGSFATSTSSPVFMVFKWSSDNNRYEAIAAYSHGKYNSATMGAAISGNGLFAASTHTIIDGATAYYAYKIATEGAYLINKYTNPVTDFAASVLFFGFTNTAGLLGQNIPITAAWWREAVAGDLD